MKKHLMIAVAAIALGTGALAADAAKGPMEGPGAREWTLAEARQHAHERADKLDKMTEKEYAEQQQRHRQMAEKFRNMTPEQRTAAREKRRDYYKAMDAGTPAAGRAVKNPMDAK